MNILAKAYHRIDKLNTLRRDFQSAKRSLLLSGCLTQAEENLLSTASWQVHDGDTMYDNASHYLSVGLSASSCIQKALSQASIEHKINSILDFPCGYGRVLRFLRSMFPNASITAAEINSSALDFCRRHFSVNPFLSKESFSDLSLPQKFDLIWCGSLFTHIDESASIDLLRFFYKHLSDQGVCIFTTHGQLSIDWLQSQQRTYGLTEDGQQKVIQDFQLKGYGYADYPHQSDYGISVVSHQRMLELAANIGQWNNICYIEHGWDNHQDVYAFARQLDFGKN